MMQRTVTILCEACHCQLPIRCDVKEVRPIPGGKEFVMKVTRDSLAWLQLFTDAHEGPFRRPS